MVITLKNLQTHWQPSFNFGYYFFSFESLHYCLKKLEEFHMARRYHCIINPTNVFPEPKTEGHLDQGFLTLLYICTIWKSYCFWFRRLAGPRRPHFLLAWRHAASHIATVWVVMFYMLFNYAVPSDEKIKEIWIILLFFPVCKGAKADIVFLTDASWSIGDDNFNKVVKFIFNTVGAFDEVNPGGIQVSVACL